MTTRSTSNTLALSIAASRGCTESVEHGTAAAGEALTFRRYLAEGAIRRHHAVDQVVLKILVDAVISGVVCGVAIAVSTE